MPFFACRRAGEPDSAGRPGRSICRDTVISLPRVFPMKADPYR